MPDSLTPHDFGVTLQLTPSAHIASLIEAVRCAAAASSYRDKRRNLVAALSPLIGHYTVADAVQLLAAVRMRTHWRTSVDRKGEQCADFDTLVQIALVLEEFSCAAGASGPDCAAARALLLRRSTGRDPDDWELDDAALGLLASLVVDDSKVAQTGDYYDAETFRPSQRGLNWVERAERNDKDYPVT